MARHKTMTQILRQQFKTMTLSGIWREVIGEPEVNGAWLAYGAEKNGKTTLCLMLAEELSKCDRVLYISGEEGLGPNFQDALLRAGVRKDNQKLRFSEYLTLAELDELLKKQRAPKIVVMDNLTIYADDIRVYGGLRKWLRDHPTILLVAVAHEEKGEPYTAVAKLARKLAKVILHVEGLACQVSGRVRGGNIMINEEKALLYHGTK